ncbi:DnaD domain-containing protein [Terribacillus sp. DMT04]|uniref:DnaD domain-containing protein n=1 Tax=Terribacillus sp. DMT04 TaxID=2850441 RepID=UPI001C2CB8F1|nr:DnaD domain-containing protein [Terribacillus sp. DMT04]QXE00247.1 DnaD domain-containing protein [Terribacillus sp. DMT04]
MNNNHLNYQQILGNPISFPGILMERYTTLGLNETEMMVILHICFFQQQGTMFPTTDELAARVTLSERDVALILRKLVQRNMIQIDDVQDSAVRSQAYSLNGLWNLVFQETVYPEPEKNTDKEEEAAIFILFEQEFGRPLSPFEIETVTLWLDEDMQPPSLIKAALREAVLMSKLNFRYIDRILREWKRKGVRSVEQARKESKSFHENQRPAAAAVRAEQQTAPARDVSVYYNWLEED